MGSGPFPTELHGKTGEQLQEAGNEFGATTGRPRRCGWLDIPIVNYAIMLNGVTKLAITKGDVLDDFEEIQVATSYKVNGEETSEIPFDITGYEITPQYKAFEGWKQYFGDKQNFSQLPNELQNYLTFIEQSVNVPMDYLSCGPGREELIEIIER